jgi:hypothetical protein
MFKRLLKIHKIAELRNIKAVYRCFRTCDKPVRVLYYYLTQNDLTNPLIVRWKTPVGDVYLKAWNAVDILTQFITFCREQYRCGSEICTAVDFGANVGISAAYFLSRNNDVTSSTRVALQETDGMSCLAWTIQECFLR